MGCIIQLVSLRRFHLYHFVMEQFLYASLIITSNKQVFALCLPVLVCNKASGCLSCGRIADFKFRSGKGVSCLSVCLRKVLIGILFDGSHIKLNLAIIDCNQCQWQGLRRDKSPIDTDFVYDVCQSSRA